MPDSGMQAKQGDSLFDGGSLRDDLERRAYPKLDRKKRRAVRRIFLYGLLHTDAMHYAIWGVNEIGAQPDGTGCPRHRGDPHNLCRACWELEPDADGRVK